MSKIININKGKDDAISALQELIEQVKSGEVLNFVVAATYSDEKIGVFSGNADWGTLCTLNGHIQSQIMWDMIIANSD